MAVVRKHAGQFHANAAGGSGDQCDRTGHVKSLLRAILKTLFSLRKDGKAHAVSIGAFAVLLEVAFARGAKVHAFLAMQLPRIRLS